MFERTVDPVHRGAHALADAERLLEQAEQDRAAAQPAAVAALSALLNAWNQTAVGNRVEPLARQAAETDDTLTQFLDDAKALDDESDDNPYQRAKIFVDAARARLVNI